MSISQALHNFCKWLQTIIFSHYYACLTFIIALVCVLHVYLPNWMRYTLMVILFSMLKCIHLLLLLMNLMYLILFPFPVSPPFYLVISVILPEDYFYLALLAPAIS